MNLEKLTKQNIKTALTYEKKGILPKQYFQILNKRAKKKLKPEHVLKISDIK